jgi:hypothetical protein
MGSNKRRREKILVADGNVTVVSNGSTTFENATSGVINLSNEQLGVFDAETGVALNVGDTYADSPKIFIAQGTSTSATPFSTPTYPLQNRPFEKSPVIDGANVTRWAGVSYSAPLNNTWLLGGEQADTTAVNVLDETRYMLSLKFDGRRTDALNGRNQPVIFPQFTTPDYSVSTVYTSTIKQRTHLLANLAQDCNKKSKVWTGNPAGSQILAILVDEDATGGMSSPQTLADIDAANDVLTLGYTDGGVAVTHTMTATEAAAITAIIASSDLALTSNILPTLLVTAPAGSAAATADGVSVETAGTGTTEADHIIFLVLDEGTAYYDRVSQLKSRVVIGMREGFDISTVACTEEQRMFEGQGIAADWEKRYQEFDSLNKFDSVQPPSGETYQHASHIDTTTPGTYDAYTIESYDLEETSSGESSRVPFVTQILVEIGHTVTTAALEDVLNPWFNSLPRSRAAVEL